MSIRLPDGWQLNKLGDICEINPSRKEIVSLPGEMDVSFVPMSAVSEDGRLLEAQTRKLRDVKKAFPHFREKDILIAKITPCFENGKRWLANSLKNGIGFGSTEFHILRPTRKVVPEWVYYFVSLPELRGEGQRTMTGTAGQKRVPSSFWVDHEIPIPPINVQEKLVVAFQRVERLKEKRERANQLTSKIVQSVFLKMFGDPIVNPRNWSVDDLGNHSEWITKGGTPTTYGYKWQNSGILFLRSECITPIGLSLQGSKAKESVLGVGLHFAFLHEQDCHINNIEPYNYRNSRLHGVSRRTLSFHSREREPFQLLWSSDGISPLILLGRYLWTS